MEKACWTRRKAHPGGHDRVCGGLANFDRIGERTSQRRPARARWDGFAPAPSGQSEKLHRLGRGERNARSDSRFLGPRPGDCRRGLQSSRTPADRHAPIGRAGYPRKIPYFAIASAAPDRSPGVIRSDGELRASRDIEYRNVEFEGPRLLIQVFRCTLGERP